MSGRRFSPSTSSSSSSSSVAEIKGKKTMEKEVMYAVFETTLLGSLNEHHYHVYKIDHSSSLQAGGGTDDRRKLGQPIWSLMDTSKSRATMIVFSTGSKIYFVGGYRFVSRTEALDHRKEAYMLDVSGGGKSQGICDLVQIASMNSHKTFALSFGPINGLFYVSSGSLSMVSGKDKFSFESYNPSTNKWEMLPNLESNKALEPYCWRSEKLIIEGSAVCGPNICFSTQAGLFVFFTETQTWRSFGRWYSNGFDFIPTNLPFVSQAHSVIVGKQEFFLAPVVIENGSPKVFKSTHLPEDKDFQMSGQPLNEFSETRHPSDFFKCFGEVEGLEDLEERRKKVPYALDEDEPALNIFYFNNRPRICSVYSGYDPSSDVEYHLLEKQIDIDICHLGFVKEVGKVRVTKTVKYKHIGDASTIPRHFLFLP